MRDSGRIRAGMGGWSYEPWRETFYPPQLPQRAELEYASRQVTVIEINGTFYRMPAPAVLAKWHDETPDDFVFSVKAPRFIVNRKVLAAGEESIARFIGGGLSQLKNKLGPILWQLAPTKKLDAEDLENFLRLLPEEIDGYRLRHALEVRHESFMTAEFLSLAREHRIATVFADSDDYPSFADVTGDFVYARLMRTVSSQVTGYSKKALATWAERAQTWARGGDPKGLPRVAKAAARQSPRDVFIFFISGAKERAPAAARHLISLLQPPPAQRGRKKAAKAR